jgi:SOS-response transcriptional repressor LexA
VPGLSLPSTLLADNVRFASTSIEGKKLAPLTRLQHRCLVACYRYWQQYGVFPTQAELSEILLHQHPQGCKSMLYSLERKGYLRRDVGQWRSWRILVRPDVDAPLLPADPRVDPSASPEDP